MDHAMTRRGSALPLAMFTMAMTLQAGAAAAGGPVVPVTGGTVQGHASTLNDDVTEFLGIPYAAPPVGPLRFRPPAPVGAFGALDATTYSGSCPQTEALIGTPSTNEDCLYLNVWSKDLTPEEPRPVMVWIHGGGNISGSTADFVPFPDYEDVRLYDASTLTSERDVVVVSMNYRLGVFGFFGHADLADEDIGFPHTGNQGLLDQVQALEWVRDNIEAFGGNPDNVTIFGESAGSWDVCAHVVSPLSAGLFHRAISESGGCSVGVASSEEADDSANDIAAAAGCDGAPDELACLRAVSVADLLAAGPAGEPPVGAGARLGINIDGAMVPAHPRDLFDSGEFNQVPYILGANSDEGTLFVDSDNPVENDAEYQAELLLRFGDLADDIAVMYPSASYSTPQDALIRVIGDSALVCSTYDVAVRVANHVKSTYVYNFSRVIPLPFVTLLDLGAFHGAEIPYVLGGVEPPSGLDATLGRQMREYWSSFAETGKPKAKKAKGWGKFKGKSYKMLRLDTYPFLNKIKNFRRAECEFWTSVYDQF